MDILVIILCSFLVLEVIASLWLFIRIRKRFIQMMRYSEYITLALIQYTTVLELMDNYVKLKQRNIAPELEREVILDIKTHYLEARENVKTAFTYYNPDGLTLSEFEQPLTLLKEFK
jgi:hypothetical protein